MEKINQTFESISSKVTGENADEVKSLLKKLQGEFEDKMYTLKSFGQENKEKRIKINEKESLIRDLNEQITSLNGQIEKLSNSNVSEELENLKAFKKNVFEQKRKGFADKFTNVMQHPNFEKAKPYFKMPEFDNDAPKWDSLTDDDIQSNMNEIDKLTNLGFFSDQNQVQPKSVFNGKVEPPKSQSELIKTAKSIEDLNKIVSSF